MLPIAKSRRTFLVAAMPRSRAAWLANLLTYSQSTCLYDPGLRARNLESVLLHMQGAPTYYVGLADTGLAFYWEELFEALPLARVIVLTRDYQAIKADWKRFAAGRPELTDAAFERNLDELWARFQIMTRGIRAREYMELDAQSLDRLDICQDVWEFAAPAQAFCRNRCAMLQRLRIELDITKVEQQTQSQQEETT